ncbi:hypothetical protein Ancab_016212 [Ancistrocladus abbreviatus]
MHQRVRNTKVGACSKGVLQLVSRKEDSAWLNGSYIVVVHPSVDILRLHTQLPSLHNFGCELRSLGGREVLISSADEEGVVRLLAEVNSRAPQCFTSARLWNPSEVARIDEHVTIRVDGAPFTIRVSEEMASCEDLFHSDVAESVGRTKLHPTSSRERPGLGAGPTSKQHVTGSPQGLRNRGSVKVDGDRCQSAVEANSRDHIYKDIGVFTANFSERGGVPPLGPFGDWSGDHVGLSENRTKLSPLPEASSVSVQAGPQYLEMSGCPKAVGPSICAAHSQPTHASLGLGEPFPSSGIGAGLDVFSRRPVASGTESVRLKVKSHRSSKKKSMDDILALGSQKTRVIMQRTLKKQLAARLKHHKKKQGKLVESKRERDKDGVSGETVTDSQILNRNRILCDLNEQQQQQNPGGIYIPRKFGTS